MGSGDVLLSLSWFFLFFIWMMLLFQVFGDIFRNSDLSRWGETTWQVFVIVLASMAAMNDFIQSAAGTTSMSNELAELADLPDVGTIDDADFAAAKARLVGSA